MKRSPHPPDYLIDAIARHARTLIAARVSSVKEEEAQRLLKKEIRKLLTYKEKRHE